MKFSVLINNYNYATYLRECIDSALNQTYPAHEIIVVDDGSTDHSLELLRQHYVSHERVKIISQPNSGQFVAIDVGIKNATGDVVCLLDSDDCFKPNYLEELAALYKKMARVDCIFCRFEPLGGNKTNPLWINLEEGEEGYDFGYTALLYRFGGFFDWIGNVTSTVSIRTRLARLLALDELGKLWDFPIQADYGVLMGVSMLGGRKYYYAKDLVQYRLHGKNNWSAPDNLQNGDHYKAKVMHNIIHNFYIERSQIDSSLISDLEMELETAPHPKQCHIDVYRRLIERCNPTSAIPSRLKPISFLKRLERSIRKRRKALGLIFGRTRSDAGIHGGETPISHDDIHVVFALDENYVIHSGVAMTSILQRTANPQTYRFYILQGETKLSDDACAKLEKICREHGASLTFVSLNVKLIEKFQIGITEYVSPAAYYRLLIPEVLPPTVDKCIYLDSDIVVMEDLANLWSIDITDVGLAAVPDAWIDSQSDHKKKYPQIDRYFNSGVLVLNLKYWRESDIVNRCLKVASDPETCRGYMDQDVLNVVFPRRWKILHRRWNIQTQLFDEMIRPPDEQKERQETFKTPGIAHFTGAKKPWDLHMEHPWAASYWQILAQTPWAPAFSAQIEKSRKMNRKQAMGTLRSRLRYLRRNIISLRIRPGEGEYKMTILGKELKATGQEVSFRKLASAFFKFVFELKFRPSQKRYKVRVLGIRLVDVSRDPADQIHIAFSPDERYLVHAGVAMASILRRAANPQKYQFYFLEGTRKYPKKVRKELSKMTRQFGAALKYVDGDFSQVEGFTVGKLGGHVTPAAYRRILLPLLLPQLERCLYLDSDLVALTDLETLWETDISGVAVGAVRDHWIDESKLYKFPQIHRYFNSGVLLMNLSRWREKDYISECLRLLAEPVMHERFADQDVLNLVLCDDHLLLPIRWNIQTSEWPKPEEMAAESVAYQWRTIVQSPGIAHFTTAQKPWNFCFDHYWAAEYWEARQLTPWNDINFIKLGKLLSEIGTKKRNDWLTASQSRSQ